MLIFVVWFISEPFRGTLMEIGSLYVFHAHYYQAYTCRSIVPLVIIISLIQYPPRVSVLHYALIYLFPPFHMSLNCTFHLSFSYYIGRP